MKIIDLPAYQRICANFVSKDFKLGNISKLRIYSYDCGKDGVLTAGHYVDGIKYCKIHLSDVPKEFLTRDFFVCALSSVRKDVLTYVKEHLGTEFDKEFFKDHIATEQYALEFDENCFEYMPLDYIDEEMVFCAMFEAVRRRFIDRRGDFDDWFYSVAKRKPEVLTQDFWTLGARLWAIKRNGKNKFLEITPEKYRTKEYYFAMCLANDTPVMEDFPEEVISTQFLIALINDSTENVASFNEKALEWKVPVKGQSKELKIWQAVLLIDGTRVRDMPLNDERIEFFLNHYSEDSSEYRYGFKDHYKRWLNKKKKDEEAKV